MKFFLIALLYVGWNEHAETKTIGVFENRQACEHQVEILKNWSPSRMYFCSEEKI